MATHLEELENELVENAGRVLIITGAGISIATDPQNQCASWPGLLRHGLQWCRDRAPACSDKSVAAFETLVGTGELIPVAGFIVKTLRAVRAGEYERWLAASVGELRVANPEPISALFGLGVQVATTNIDNLCEQVSGRLPVTQHDSGGAIQFLRGDNGAILHLHGHYLRPDTVVLDGNGYQSVCESDEIQNVLRSALTMRTVVFVGCGAGLADPNFGRLVDWSRKALAHSSYSHYRLVRDSELEETAKESEGLCIQPISYGQEYDDLALFLSQLADRVARRRTPKSQLDLLSGRQSDFLTRKKVLESERTSLSASDFLRRRIELARALWEAGGRRSAALDVWSVFNNEASRVSPTERVQFGAQVAEMLLDDELLHQATETLRRILPDLDTADLTPAAAGRVHELQARCMNERCAYDQMLTAVKRALPLAGSDDRARLKAQRAEAQLLQGELDEALRGLNVEDCS